MPKAKMNGHGSAGKPADKRVKNGRTPHDPTRPLGDKNPPIETQFQPGNTAAVGHGRPHTLPELRDLIQRIVNSPLPESDMTRLEAMIKAMTTSRKQADSRTVLEYGFGKVPQPIELSELSDEQLMLRALDLLQSLGIQIDPTVALRFSSREPHTEETHDDLHQ